MKIQCILATGNADKVREVREILSGRGIPVYSTKELGISSDPEETGTSFEENAMIKAEAAAKLVMERPDLRERFAPGCNRTSVTAVIADDSGLVIDAMDGAPGIQSARFMGHETSYREKMNAILGKMRDVPDEERSARFVAAIAAVILPHAESDSGERFAVRGTMEGRIGHEIRGEHGFGYDPFFFLPEYGRTSAELLPEEKNRISHRGQGIRAMTDELIRRYGTEN